MNTEITFTVGGLLTSFLTICAGIATIGAACAAVLRAIKHFKAPEESQNQRLAAVETTMEKHMEYLAKDKARIDSLEEGNQAAHRLLLALANHALDGNAVEELRRAKNDMQEYLIRR